MKAFITGVITFFFALSTADAQRICGSINYKQEALASNPSLKDVFKKIEDQVAAAKTVKKGNMAWRDTSANEIIYIPVVVHLLFKTAEQNITNVQIISQINALNKDFRMLNNDRINTPQSFKSLAGDSRIQFSLAQLDPQGKRTSGIERKYTMQDSFATNDAMKMALKGGIGSWDSKHYLNIWVCNISNKCLGYATPPGAAADMDGLVIAYDVFGTTGNLRPLFNKGRTATHEIGHWLGLLHTWGDDKCGDDQVDDTPKQESYNYGCPQFPKLSLCSPDNNGDMFMNFMDFSDDACMNMFTKGQVKRMRSLFAKDNVRNSFLESFACDSSLEPANPLKVIQQPVTPSSLAGLSSTKIYPNPFQTVTTIECKAATAIMTKNLNIFNSMGMKVFSGILNQEKTVVDLTALMAGVYVVEIGDGQDRFITRIIRQ